MKVVEILITINIWSSPRRLIWFWYCYSSLIFKIYIQFWHNLFKHMYFFSSSITFKEVKAKFHWSSLYFIHIFYIYSKCEYLDILSWLWPAISLFATTYPLPATICYHYFCNALWYDDAIVIILIHQYLTSFACDIQIVYLSSILIPVRITCCHMNKKILFPFQWLLW